MPLDQTTLPIPARSRERREPTQFSRGVLAGLGLPFAAYAIGGFGGGFVAALAILTVAAVSLGRVSTARVAGVLVGAGSGLAIGLALMLSMVAVAMSGDW